MDKHSILPRTAELASRCTWRRSIPRAPKHAWMACQRYPSWPTGTLSQAGFTDDILTLNYFDFSTRNARRLFKISGGGAFFGLSVSPDGRYVLYHELDDYRSDIMLVENFR